MTLSHYALNYNVMILFKISYAGTISSAVIKVMDIFVATDAFLQLFRRTSDMYVYGL